MKAIKTILAASILAALSISTSFAANITGNFQATSTLSSACTLTANNVVFGSFTPAATGTVAGNGGFLATCSQGVAYTISVNTGGSGTFERSMSGVTAGNNDKLAYRIYTSGAATTIIGDGTGTTGTIPKVGSGISQTTILYGLLDKNQYIQPDNYTDNLTATITY